MEPGNIKQHSAILSTHPRELKPHARCDLSDDRPSRLHAEKEHLPKNSKNMGSFQYGSICQELECSNKKVLLLDETPKLSGSRCSKPNLAKIRSLCIPTVHNHPKSTRPHQPPKTALNYTNCSNMESSKLLQSPASHEHRLSNTPTSFPRNPDGQTGQPRPNNLPPSRMEIIRGKLQKSGFSGEVTETIIHKQRPQTQSTYQSAWAKWVSWNMERDNDPIQPSLPNFLSFLNDQFKSGKAIGTLKVYRFAIAEVLDPVGNNDLANHKSIRDLFDAMANLRPKAHKSPKSWKVKNVLDLFKKWGPAHNLSLSQLTYKLTTLLALSSGARCSELSNLDTSNMVTREDGMEFRLTKHKKARKASTLPGTLFIPSFRDVDPSICPINCLEQYLTVTGRLGSLCNDQSIATWGDDPILRKTTKPYTGVTPKTISTWISKVIREAEGWAPDSSLMGHSTRSQGAATAHAAGLSVQEIMSAADWRSEEVFKKYYHNPAYSSKFGRAVLSSVRQTSDS